MFIGISEHPLDKKNRVFVPKRILDYLPPNPDGTRVAYLTSGLDGCVYLFSEGGWNAAVEQLNTGAFESPEQRAAGRLFFSYAARQELDGSGRLLIPEALRKRAGLDKEVVMVGVQNRTEIWSRERWEKFSDENIQLLEEIGTVMRKPASTSKHEN
jgi:MraZ protein